MPFAIHTLPSISNFNQSNTSSCKMIPNKIYTQMHLPILQQEAKPHNTRTHITVTSPAIFLLSCIYLTPHRKRTAPVHHNQYTRLQIKIYSYYKQTQKPLSHQRLPASLTRSNMVYRVQTLLFIRIFLHQLNPKKSCEMSRPQS